LEPGRAITVLSWNVQFCAGRSREFFYDGGPAVQVEPGAVLATLDRIGEVLRDVDADIVLLQEVDRGSDRTQRIDQHEALLARAPYPVSLSTPYYRSPYVPHPPQDHLGRMDMHLSVFSRVGVRGATRWQLPMLHESWVRRQFNLRRALLDVDLGAARVFQTHLSAFSRGDGTLPQQIDAICDHLAATDRESTPWLLAGDFNALPPGDDPARLGPAADLYAEERTPVAPLFERWRSVVPAERHQAEPERWRTWLPHGSTTAERAIDHAFTSPSVEILEVRVMSEISDTSDHLPLVTRIRMS
jgi:endonuclease/exonuclease/phosphatase family metal-dependent hydrolase